MYKGAAKNQVARMSAGSGNKTCHHSYQVVYFRRRNDNCGKLTVFRYVRDFPKLVDAKHFLKGCKALCKALVTADGEITIHGDESVVEEWKKNQKGVNYGAHPFYDPRYTDLSAMSRK